MFEQKTFGTCVKFAVDGRQIMELIYHEIREAKSSIWIANYDLDPDLCLVRESEHQKKYFQRSYDESDLVTTSCQERINEEDIKNTATNTLVDIYEDPFVLQNLLIEKAKEKVDIKIILWEPRLIVRTLPISKRRRGIEGREEKAEIIKKLAKDHGVDNYISVQLDSKAPTLTSGYHEKIIIIDNQIGFCGGQDLSKGKWDTSNHSFDNVMRDNGSEPWHDVNVMVKGPILRYFIFHFNQRWVHSILKSNEWVKELVTPNSIGAYLSPPHIHLSRPSFTATNENEERIEMVALRTWKQFDENGDVGIFGIREWYDIMFRNAKHNIYLEDQFPFQDNTITQSLIKRLKEQRGLKLITVGPMDPNLPGFIFGKIAHESTNEINYNLSALRKAGEGERVGNYSLVSQDPGINSNRKQIYVHSKIMIVDDKWITIGSANTDRDGFEASTEFDLGITSPTLAQQLRVKLWTEHIGEEYLRASPSLDLNNFDEGFQAWERIANDNGKRVERNEVISGHIYYYNFQEMGFPPPYTGAKGGNKFQWF